MTDPLVIVINAVFILLGVITFIYFVGWVIALWSDRPAVVRHPITKQWTAARSLRISPPRTQKVTYPPGGEHG